MHTALGHPLRLLSSSIGADMWPEYCSVAYSAVAWRARRSPRAAQARRIAGGALRSLYRAESYCAMAACINAVCSMHSKRRRMWSDDPQCYRLCRLGRTRHEDSPGGGIPLSASQPSFGWAARLGKNGVAALRDERSARWPAEGCSDCFMEQRPSRQRTRPSLPFWPRGKVQGASRPSGWGVAPIGGELR
jgi:hypothetical protein